MPILFAPNNEKTFLWKFILIFYNILTEKQLHKHAKKVREQIGS